MKFLCKILILSIILFLRTQPVLSEENADSYCSKAEEHYTLKNFSRSRSYLSRCFRTEGMSKKPLYIKLDALLDLYTGNKTEFIKKGSVYLTEIQDPAFRYLLGLSAMKSRDYKLALSSFTNLGSQSMEKQSYFPLPLAVDCQVPEKQKTLPLQIFSVSDDMRISALFLSAGITAAMDGRNSTNFTEYSRELRESGFKRNLAQPETMPYLLYSNPQNQEMYTACINPLSYELEKIDRKNSNKDWQAGIEYLHIVHKNRIAIFRTHSSYYAYGDLLFREGQYIQALHAFRKSLEAAGWPERILKTNQEIPRIMRRLSAVYEHLGKKKDALIMEDLADILDRYYSGAIASEENLADSLNKKTSENLYNREGLLYRIAYFRQRNELQSAQYSRKLLERDRANDMTELLSTVGNSYPY